MARQAGAFQRRWRKKLRKRLPRRVHHRSSRSPYTTHGRPGMAVAWQLSITKRGGLRRNLKNCSSLRGGTAPREFTVWAVSGFPMSEEIYAYAKQLALRAVHPIRE